MAIEPLILLNGTTADANDVMALFNEIYSNIANNNIAANAGIAFSKLQALTSGKILVGNNVSVPAAVTMHGGATIDTTGLVTLSGSGSGGTVPIGTVIPFLDYNGINSFDSDFWKMMDGTVIGVGPMAGQFTEDLSGRYLIGFGTDGGGNIGSTAWTVGQVGNIGSQINISHSHTVAAHTHSLQNHTHTLVHTHDMQNHTHGIGSIGGFSISSDGAHTHGTPNHEHDLAFTTQTATSIVGNLIYSSNASNSNLHDQLSGAGLNTFRIIQNTTENSGSGTTTSQAPANHDHGGSVSGGSGSTGVPSTNTTSGASSTTTSVPSTNTSGSASPGTDTQLSASQDIRPSSIRCRYLIRII